MRAARTQATPVAGDAARAETTEGPRKTQGTSGERPADAARAALRRPGSAHPPGSPSAGQPPIEGAAPTASSAHGAVGARPGDIAREALRAARAKSRQDPAEPAGETGAPARKLPPPAAGSPNREPASPGAREDAEPFADASLRREAPADVRASAGEPVPGAVRPGAGGPGGDSARELPPAVSGARSRESASAGAREGVAPLADASLRREAPADVREPAGEPAPAAGSRPDVREPGDAPAPGVGRPAVPEPGGAPAPGVGRPAVREPGGAPAAAASQAAPSHPSPPSSPRSMAAPNRDSEHRRTFPALPPRPVGGELQADAGEFAASWWGNAWVRALEEGALDVNRLARGRGYAEQGHVDAITVTPGLVLAYVQGSRPRPYRVQVRLRTLGDEDWERFLDAAVERPAHIAALLDKEMPESLAGCGVPLLPEPGDLAPQCSCPDHGHPCKHAAALCYQTARLLDADPFVLLLLRGRGERELLDALSRRNATRAARAAQEREPDPLPGIRATDALAARRLPPLPPPLPTPPHPGQPPAYPSLPNGGPDSFALDQLATDAAARAHALLATGRDEVGELTFWQDAVRLAAARPGSGLTAATRSLYSALATAAGRTPAELARAVAAWRQGGPDGLAVLEEAWDPPAGRFDRARPLLLAADLPAFRPWRNHLTHPRGHVQLRFGREGLWYAYESEPGHDDWWPRGTPDPDPVGALTGLDGADGF
ncbi:SWIM zinc finger family protein [Streptomyces sp. NPDC101166]|uniref:SWIM zinc finger family protein n=1 Tax=Streptomyces sp. NPDC101166 TaxID=3366120 RepID=UPI00381AA686